MEHHAQSADGPSSPPAPVLAAQGISKRFGDTVALHDVSLTVRERECVALVGESGSGKTTLLRCFNLLVRPDSGRVLIGAADARSMDVIQLRRRIGYVPQDGGLLPHWRVGRNVELVLRLRGAAEDIQSRADEALCLVGLDPGVFRERWPRELSGGQRQRVAIARALAAAPGIVLLDEPFGALDAISRADLQDSFAELRAGAESKMACVLVTHDLHEAFLLADRIAVLHEGRIEQLGPPEALVDRPATSYVRELLARARVDRAALGELKKGSVLP
jgi:osmoprotectant transport system ATP-binding protein